MNDVFASPTETKREETLTFKKGQQLICQQPYRSIDCLTLNASYVATCNSYVNAYGVEVVRVIDNFANEREYHVERFKKAK